MPMLPDALRSEMAGRGAQARTGSRVGDTSQDELGVLPSKMGKATAAMVFAARIVGGKHRRGPGGNFPQNRKQKVSGPSRWPR